jgi:CHAD domain-containing protein
MGVAGSTKAFTTSAPPRAGFSRCWPWLSDRRQQADAPAQGTRRRHPRRLGPLRDLTVQRELASRLEVPGSEGALERFARAIEKDFRRSARKVRRRLHREDVSGLRKDQRRIRRRLRGLDERDPGRQVIKAVRASLSELRARRKSVDPNRLDTLHRMRLSLKRFRYLVEGVEPLLTGVSGDAVRVLHDLQTNMGDLHDIEVLSGALVEFGKGEQARTAQVAPVLAQLEARHSAMLRSFLESADIILEYWERGLGGAARRTGTTH